MERPNQTRRSQNHRERTTRRILRKQSPPPNPHRTPTPPRHRTKRQTIPPSKPHTKNTNQATQRNPQDTHRARTPRTTMDIQRPQDNPLLENPTRTLPQSHMDNHKPRPPSQPQQPTTHRIHEPIPTTKRMATPHNPMDKEPRSTTTTPPHRHPHSTHHRTNTRRSTSTKTPRTTTPHLQRTSLPRHHQSRRHDE